MRSRGKSVAVTAFLGVVFLLGTGHQASALPIEPAAIENIQINFSMVTYYQGAASPSIFQVVNYGSLTTDISVTNLPVSTSLGTNSHVIKNGTFSMTPAELKQDVSTPVVLGAHGIFHAGTNNGGLVKSTFSLQGELYESGSNTLLASGLLLEAEMTVTEFELQETLPGQSRHRSNLVHADGRRVCDQRAGRWAFGH